MRNDNDSDWEDPPLSESPLSEDSSEAFRLDELDIATRKTVAFPKKKS